MNNSITKSDRFSLTPTTLDEAMKYADIMAKSNIVPKAYQGKPADILVAVQMGAELGLKPLQALQNIAVINAKPSIYGDSLIALVQAHPEFEDIKEYFDEKIQGAICVIKRKGQSEHSSIFTIEDAKKAGLWGKPGPWSAYPRRMLQMRARGFALRDKFADALGGLITSEEARDYPADSSIKDVSRSSLADRLQEIIADNNDAEVTAEDLSLHELQLQLNELITRHDVPEATVKKWIDYAEVGDIYGLSESVVKKCIEHIKNNYA